MRKLNRYRLQAFIATCRPLAAIELATAAQVVSFIGNAAAQGVC